MMVPASPLDHTGRLTGNGNFGSKQFLLRCYIEPVIAHGASPMGSLAHPVATHEVTAIGLWQVGLRSASGSCRAASSTTTLPPLLFFGPRSHIRCRTLACCR